MTRLALAWVFLAAAGTAVSAAPDSYPMFKGGPQRLGRADLKLLGPVTLAWKAEAEGAFYSSPAIEGGEIFIGNVDHHLYKYRLEDGKRLAAFSLPERIYGSSPQLEDGLAYVACVNGCGYAFHRDGGAVKSSFCVEKLQVFGNGPDILGSILVEDGRAYFGSDNHGIYAFDLKSGKKSWFFEAGNKVHDAAPALWEKILFVCASDGALYALDKDSGALWWKSAEFEKLNTTVMAYEGRVYFGAADGVLRCMDARRGELLWGFRTPKGIMSSPALSADGKSLVFGGADGSVYCIALDGGTLKWKFETGGPVLASPLVTGPSVWIGSYDKYFYGLNMADGKEIFRYKTGSGIFSSAAAVGSKIVVGGRDNTLYCFDATPSH